MAMENNFDQWWFLKKKETTKRTIQNTFPAGMRPSKRPQDKPAAICFLSRLLFKATINLAIGFNMVLLLSQDEKNTSPAQCMVLLAQYGIACSKNYFFAEAAWATLASTVFSMAESLSFSIKSISLASV